VSPVAEDELREALGDAGFERLRKIAKIDIPDPEPSDEVKAAIARADSLVVGIEPEHALLAQTKVE
jgi:hypothetical protein